MAEESVTKSGLVIPDTAKESRSAPRSPPSATTKETIKVAPGDLVLFARCAGTELRLDGADYLILDVSDLLAVIKTAAVKAA